MSDSENMVPPSEELETDDDVLSFSQRTRKRIVDKLTEKGIPEDAKDQTILLTALADMDRTAIGNKRIQSKEKQGQLNRQTGLIIAALTERFGARSPFERSGQSTQPPEFKADGLPPLELKPGETEIGIANRGFAEFMNDVESRADSSSKT